MTYALSEALQQAVYQQLIADPALTAEVGTAIYDMLPAGSLPALYVTLGAETVRDRSDVSGAGALHRFTVTVVANTTGFSAAKRAAAAVSDALVDAPLTLIRGQLVGLWFDRATAARQSNGDRSIALRFSARLEDS
ncbi:DUF3168 domain-containing protein [Phaeobacter sp. B1627]|uniref:DUF3168 domain-containing protein n=1 Tax=Phaeobacter sp. B1627 TaxID=2583809 RepID=UPI00111B52FE|nr:DUF3168 domain-containing protein [Phaeobacter sp. B1627]TNJ46724.1 DUF3168 domain-containing protein [Phaeobacter sp. B1627]